MRSEEEIRKRIKDLEAHAKTLTSKSRVTPRRWIKELRWALGEIEMISYSGVLKYE